MALELIFPILRKLLVMSPTQILLFTFLHSLWVPHSYKRVAETAGRESHPYKTLKEGKILKMVFINMLLALG